MPERLAALLAPERGLAELWAERIEGEGRPADAAVERCQVVVRALLAHLDTGEPVRLPERLTITLPDLTALRQLAHARVIAGAAEDEALPALLSRLDQVIDELLTDFVDIRMRDLEVDAHIDPLTAVGNRRALERDLPAALARALRHQHVLSIAMIDLDGLKAVNDVEGHDAGDVRLRDLAQAFVHALRQGDGFYRIGGDEFVAVLPYSDADAVDLLLERMRATAPPFSAGVATAPDDGRQVSELLGAADRRLLERRRGRGERRPSGPRPARARRSTTPSDAVEIASVTTTVTQDAATVEVLLRHDAMSGSGRASGTPFASVEPRLAASATLDALADLGFDLVAHVEAVEVRQVNGRTVVIVLVSTRAGDVDTVVSGSAVVRSSVAEACGHAVIQALLPPPPKQVINL